MNSTPTVERVHRHSSASHRLSTALRSRTTTVRPVGRQLGVVYLPALGRIAAGTPIPAQQSAEDVLFPFPRELIGDGNLFLLQVSGHSMIDAAIEDGDWVVIREQPVAENGEIVAAMIDGDATIKTFKRANDHVWLMPANPVFRPILGDDATIIGKAVALLRRL